MNLVASAHEYMQSLTGITLDVVVLIVAFVILAAYGLYLGKSRLMAFVFAFYPAMLLYAAFPYTANITFWKGSAQQVALSKLLIFGVIFIICNVVVHRFIQGDFSFGKSKRFFEIATLAISGLILMLVVWHYAVPLESVYGFSGGISRFFSGSVGVFWWVVVSFAGLYIISR